MSRRRGRDTRRGAAALISASVLAAGCASAPTPRQADREPSGEAAAIVASVGYSPTLDEIRVETIRNEYPGSGIVDVRAAEPLGFPEYETSFLEPPLDPGTLVTEGQVVATVAATDEARASASAPLPDQVDVVAPFGGIIVGSRRDIRIGRSDDLAIIVTASDDAIADLRVGDQVTLSRDDLVGGLELGTIESLPHGDARPDGEADVADDPDDADGDGGNTDRRIVVASPRLDGPNAIPYGTDLTVTLFGQPRTDVTVVGPGAVRDDQGRTFIVVRDPDGTRRRVDVSVGASTTDATQITGTAAGAVEPGLVVVVP